MKIIDVEQGSNLWLSWRKTVITATDCPSILGSSPWSSAYKCWQRKLGLIEEQKGNESMERGKRLEPIARARFIEEKGINMKAAVVESSQWNFLGASLDGLSDDHRCILEIKCGGSKLHKEASEGRIPEYYMHQMQHQLLVTGAAMCFYYSFDGEQGICIEVLPDPEFQAQFMPKAREFWRCVAFNEAPDMQTNDYKDMNGDESLKYDLIVYNDLDAQIKSLEQKKKEQRKRIIESCEEESCICMGTKIIKVKMPGRIDYESIPELQDIDIERYRKEPIAMWRIVLA